MSRVATDHIWRLVCRGVLVFASLVAVASPMATAGSSEYIASFDVHYLLAKSGKLTVEETIAYEFGSNVRHGIYRDIPTQYRDDKNNYFYTTVEVGGVYDGAGAPVHYTEGTTSSGLQIRIGDAAVTVTGEHIYKINYSIQPIVRPGDSGDRLALNVNGTSWQVPVQHATASLSLADGLVASSVRCYTGAMGSTETACSAVSVPQAVNYASSRELTSGENLSVEADFARGSFDTYMAPGAAPKPSPWVAWLPAIIGGYAVLILGALAWPVVRAFRNWRRKKDQTVIAQYESPDGLTPGELGLLVDGAAGMPEIAAILLDLAVRGYMRITQTSPKSIFQPAKYQFSALKGGEGLDSADSKLYFAIFSGGTTVAMSDLDRTRMASATKDAKDIIKKSLVDKGYVKKASIDMKMMGVGMLVIIPLAIVAPPLFIVLVIMTVLFQASANLTEDGYKEWARVKGFQEFLSVTEADRLKFSDAPEKTPELFSKLLPAAVALGVEKQWAKQFEGIDVSPATGGWYAGDGQAFTTGMLVGSLAGDFAGAVSSSFTPISSGSSGGFSGGGFSGGGGGGGGGGSW